MNGVQARASRRISPQWKQLTTKQLRLGRRPLHRARRRFRPNPRSRPWRRRRILLGVPRAARLLLRNEAPGHRTPRGKRSSGFDHADPRPTVSFFGIFPWEYLMGARLTRTNADLRQTAGAKNGRAAGWARALSPRRTADRGSGTTTASGNRASQMHSRSS